MRSEGCYRSAWYMARKSFAAPTARGRASRKERLEDAALSFATHLITANLYAEHGEGLTGSRNGVPGSFERLYTQERSHEVRAFYEIYAAT